MKIRAIALNTFREAIRDRILYLLFFFAAISLAFSRLLAVLTVGDRVKIIKDVGLASISVFGMLMAILIGTGLVYKEIDKKTIYTLLAKPIPRWQFLLGKFFGLALTLFIMILAMGTVFLVIVLLHTGKLESRLLLAILFIFLELVLITAVAILFSCFSTPILSSLFTLSFYLIGHLSWGLETLVQKTRSEAARAGGPERSSRSSSGRRTPARWLRVGRASVTSRSTPTRRISWGWAWPTSRSGGTVRPTAS